MAGTIDINDNINSDGYIPYDEPDKYNLLDAEYKRYAIQLNHNYMPFVSDIDSKQMTQEILYSELKDKQRKLPKLQGWMDKKSPSFARGWQRRWVRIKDYNIFYGKKKIIIKDPSNPEDIICHYLH